MRGNHHTQTPTRAKSSAVQLLTMLTIVLLGLMACRSRPDDASILTATLSSTDPETDSDAEATNTASALGTTSTPNSTLIPPVGPDDYPENVNPLTGLIVADLSVLQRRPMAIKVANTYHVRPQSGLSFADLVFEHYAEGGLTRLTAVYYGRSAQRVGSTRSGRLIDLEIVPMYDAILVTSGYSNGVRELMRAQPWLGRNISISFGYYEPYLFRIEDEEHVAPHNLFASPSAVWTLADQRDFNQPPNLTPGMSFNEEVPEGWGPATSIELRYIGVNTYWQYNPAIGLYARWQDGEDHIDELTNQQLTAANVVVISANHVLTDIVEDELGNRSIEIQIWGQGPVSIFRDGQRFDGLWHRDDREHMLTFTDEEGNILPLKPGNTWFQMIPMDFGSRLVVES